MTFARKAYQMWGLVWRAVYFKSNLICWYMFLLVKKKFLFESTLIFICSLVYKLLGQFGSNEKHYSVNWVCAPTRSAMNITYWVVWTYTETSFFRWYASFSVSCQNLNLWHVLQSAWEDQVNYYWARPEVNNTTLS